MKMNAEKRKNIINTIAWWIPVRSWRYKFRIHFEAYGRHLNIKGNIRFFERQAAKRELNLLFNNHKVRKKSVLIVEPNAYHAEILPGFVKYFIDIGYNVDLFLRDENIENSPFINKNNTTSIIHHCSIFNGNPIEIKKMLSSDKIQDYHFLFFSTFEWFETNTNKTFFYIDFLDFEPKTKFGTLIVIHTIDYCFERANKLNYFQERRVFSLSGFQNTPMLNPHYFKDYSFTKKNKITHFVVVGHTVNNTLIEELLKNGYSDFNITIIKRQTYTKIPNHLKNYLTIIENPSYEKMYKIISKADFYLLPLDPKTQSRYLNNTTTGSRQLILGFLKPCLINDEFAKAYNFSEVNSILHKDNDIKGAMIKAINMDEKQYSKMQSNLKILSEKVYNISLNNLKNTCERLENEK